MNQKLNKIYELALENDLIPTKLFSENKIFYADIQILIARNIIKKTKRGYYELVDYSKFYDIALNNLKAGYYDEAKKYFIACYNHNVEIASVSYYLMGLNIIDHDISNAFKYFKSYYDNNELNYNCNLYLYLLYHFYKLPNNYLLCASTIKLNDILIPNPSNDPEINSQNDIRCNIYYGKLNMELYSNSFENVIFKEIFNIIYNYQKDSRFDILKLINSKKYEELYTYLEEYSKYYKTTKSIKYSKKLVMVLLDIQKTKKVPEPEYYVDINISSVFEAIDIANYDLALNKELEKIKESNYDMNNDYIYLLLKAIVQEKDNIEKNNIINASNLLLEKIINDLKNNNLDEALANLRIYLKNANKLDYEFLIIDLLKISILSQDLSFNKAVTTLEELQAGTFNYDLSSYILNFYNYLSIGEFNLARLYLDIISNSKKFNIEWNLTPQMTKVLLMSENVLSYQENMQTLKELDAKFNPPKKEEPTPSKKEEPKPPVESTTFVMPKPKAPTNTGISSYYQKIPNLNGIVNSFLNDININIIIQSTKVSRELILISALLIAKEYFLMGNTYLGEKYLNIVRSAKHKSKTVCDYLYEVDQNKEEIDESYTSPLTPLLKNR